jgi:hypothetical protein
MIPVRKRAKTVHALDRAATVIGKTAGWQVENMNVAGTSVGRMYTLFLVKQYEVVLVLRSLFQAYDKYFYIWAGHE